MQFNHDNMPGAHLAAGLADLVLREHVTPAEVEQTIREHGIRWPHLTAGATAALLEWGVRLRTVFAAASVDERTRAINALLEAGTAGVSLTTHDGRKPHLHFTPEDDDVVGRVRAVTAGGLAVFSVEAEGSRLGVCARAGCGRSFVDTSRNGRRRYCSPRCGNGDAVTRYRTAAR